MTVRELKKSLKDVKDRSFVSVSYVNRFGRESQAIGLYVGENGYNLFLEMATDRDAPVATGHVALKNVTSVHAYRSGRQKRVYA